MQAVTLAYQNLANAIVLQAVDDYRKALNGITYDDRYPPETIIKKVEDFFRSEWFRTLTKIEGEYLITQLKQEHIENRKEQK